MRENDFTIKDALGAWKKQFKHEDKLDERLVVKYWAELMGPTTVKYTSSVKLSKKILYVKIKAAALKQDLEFRKEEIISSLNEMFGTHKIDSIVVK